MNYDFEAKQAGYRVPAWNFVDRMCRSPRGMRKVAILDTKQGLEARHLVAIGYKPENILVVNYNPAELAWMTRWLERDGIEGVRTKAGDFVDVLMRWDERLDVIGFDTTSNLRAKSFVRLSAVVEKHRPACAVVVMLAGREGGTLSDGINSFAARWERKEKDSLNQEVIREHWVRVLLAAQSATAPVDGQCHSHIGRLRWARYMSTRRQPMVWAVFERIPHDKPGRWGCLEADASALDLIRQD